MVKWRVWDKKPYPLNKIGQVKEWLSRQLVLRGSWHNEFPISRTRVFLNLSSLAQSTSYLIPNACLSWSINLQPCGFYRLVSMPIAQRSPLVIAAFIASNRKLLPMSALDYGSKCA